MEGGRDGRWEGQRERSEGWEARMDEGTDEQTEGVREVGTGERSDGGRDRGTE